MMTTGPFAPYPLPCPPVEDEGARAPDEPPRAGRSLIPGLAEASVPTPSGPLGAQL